MAREGQGYPRWRCDMMMTWGYNCLLTIIIIYSEFFFFTSALADGVSLESERPHVSRTLLSILADFSDTVVCIVSPRPLISKSSRSFTNPLVIVPWEQPSLSCIFNFPARSRYLFFQFYSVVSRDSKVHNSCSFVFYGISTFVVYLMPNPFYINKQFSFKQFSLA